MCIASSKTGQFSPLLHIYPPPLRTKSCVSRFGAEGRGGKNGKCIAYNEKSEHGIKWNGLVPRMEEREREGEGGDRIILHNVKRYYYSGIDGEREEGGNGITFF